jgi:hypothetical protein
MANCVHLHISKRGPIKMQIKNAADIAGISKKTFSNTIFTPCFPSDGYVETNHRESGFLDRHHPLTSVEAVQVRRPSSVEMR